MTKKFIIFFSIVSWPLQKHQKNSEVNGRTSHLLLAIFVIILFKFLNTKFRLYKNVTSVDFLLLDLRVFLTGVAGVAATFLPDRVRRAPTKKIKQEK